MAAAGNSSTVPDRARSDVRLADLLVALSGVADLGMGMPVGSSARAAVLAVALARGSGCPEPEVAAVFYASLLQHIGCTATRTR